MNIGTNDYEDLDYDYTLPTESEELEDIQGEDVVEDSLDEPHGEVEEDFISALLKTRGIEDKSKIKFETEDGGIEETDWDSLDNETKLNILETSEQNEESNLDSSEILLINAIRQSLMSPSEYLQYIQKTTIDNYIRNATQQQAPVYQIDQYSDDELYVLDFLSRTKDATEQEALDALEQAKANPALYKKLIGAIRTEYKTIEEEEARQALLDQEQAAQAQYQLFSSVIAQQINDFTDFSGYDLNMEPEDMQELYEFITGFDAAGNNHFSKALNDPKLLVQMAWFALRGQEMIEDITDYFLKEITNVRKTSYAKGLEDAKSKRSSNVVFKQKPTSKNENYYDLDDFE